MSSLFGFLGSTYKRHPHKFATYLGDGAWEIMGTTYDGSVTTVGGGAPTVGKTYPAICRDPDSWRGWAVMVRSTNRITSLATGFISLFSNHLRHGINFEFTGWQRELDDPEDANTSVIFPTVLPEPGDEVGIVRVYQDRVIISLDESVTDGGEAVSVFGHVLNVDVTEDGGVFILVEGTLSPAEQSCAAAKLAAFGAIGGDGFDQGYDDFTAEELFDPCAHVGSLGDDYPAQSPYDEEPDSACWDAGIVSAFKFYYSQGWESAGGTIPEEFDQNEPCP